ncbi:uncharacterized protein VTP21DRAFT_8415 [Calcarisporiella thermophila]|uniref:uncharacterized protein n=1 Tax=Calcarisporiella thermophila TaxID=911321 RepID=UPI0037445E49
MDIELDETDSSGKFLHKDPSSTYLISTTRESFDEEDENGFDGDECKFTRVAGPLPRSVFTIVVLEFAERSAYYGASTLFQHYMIEKLFLPPDVSTAINRGFIFLAYTTTILGAVLADQWFGRYRVCLFFCAYYLLGLILLTISALPDLPDIFRHLGFYTSLYAFISFGTGGIKANVSAFAAEQVPADEKVLNKRVIHDHKLTLERVFRYFYWSINIGALLGQLICPFLANNKGFEYAYLVPTVIFAVGIIVFIFDKKSYVMTPPGGSILRKVLHCMRYAIAAKRTHDSSCGYCLRKDHSCPEKRYTWLDYAKSDDECLEWNNQFVDDLKLTLKACKVFMIYPIYWALYNNMFDNFVTMGLHMQRPAWLGPEQLNVFNSMVLVIIIPIFDILIFPFLHNRGFKFGHITRISIGFGITSICFLYVTILQAAVYNSPPYYNFTNISNIIPGTMPVNHISIWWLIIPYVLIATSELFSSITGLEFAYQAATPELKSVVISLFLFTNALGSLIGLLLAIWSVDPQILWVYAFESVVMGAFTLFFYLQFRSSAILLSIILLLPFFIFYIIRQENTKTSQTHHQAIDDVKKSKSKKKKKRKGNQARSQQEDGKLEQEQSAEPEKCADNSKSSVSTAKHKENACRSNEPSLAQDQLSTNEKHLSQVPIEKFTRKLVEDKDGKGLITTPSRDSSVVTSPTSLVSENPERKEPSSLQSIAMKKDEKVHEIDPHMDVENVHYARVLRIKSEKPVQRIEEPVEPGWGRVHTVPHVRASTNPAPQLLTKKQRENQLRAQRKKELKQQADEVQAARLAAHKRALENERIKEFFARGAGRKPVVPLENHWSNKQREERTAQVNEHGALVWE